MGTRSIRGTHSRRVMHTITKRAEKLSIQFAPITNARLKANVTSVGCGVFLKSAVSAARL
jgi:hypothetical protein